jgi:uncharacterized Zn finger protein (UPF0148 family)
MASRCPHCGSPLPLGSGLCFDCGARVPSADHDPWEEQDRAQVRPNTGEKAYRRDQANQRRHETRHTDHGASRESERAREGVRHFGPNQSPRTPQSPQRPPKPQNGAAWPNRQKPQEKTGNTKSARAVLGIVVFLLLLIMRGCSL